MQPADRQPKTSGQRIPSSMDGVAANSAREYFKGALSPKRNLDSLPCLNFEQKAPIDALTQRRVAGAGLDTTMPEPLPPEAALWRTLNVLIAAHTAGNTPRFLPRVVISGAGAVRALPGRRAAR